jgi:hypothetical protein
MVEIVVAAMVQFSVPKYKADAQNGFLHSCACSHGKLAITTSYSGHICLDV